LDLGPLGEGGGLADFVAVVVEEVPDGGLVDVESLTGGGDGHTGGIVDEAVGGDAFEETGAFGAVGGLGGEAGVLLVNLSQLSSKRDWAVSLP
jgi:hypothetical protein